MDRGKATFVGGMGQVSTRMVSPMVGSRVISTR